MFLSLQNSPGSLVAVHHAFVCRLHDEMFCTLRESVGSWNGSGWVGLTLGMAWMRRALKEGGVVGEGRDMHRV